MTDQLRDDLATMAEEASTVDMGARVIAGSRQLGFQRRVAACVAVLVVLFAGAVGLAAVWGPFTGDAAPPAQQTVDADPMASTDALPGDLYYQGPGGNGAGANVVTLFRQGADGKVEEVHQASGVSSPMVVSPDGRYAAWSTHNAGTGEYTMVLLDLATEDTRDLYKFDSLVSECASPVWTTDGEPTIIAADPGGGGQSLWVYNVETDQSQRSIWIPEDLRGMGDCLSTDTNGSIYFNVKGGADAPPKLVRITADDNVVPLDPLAHQSERFDLDGSAFTALDPAGDQACVQQADPKPGIHADDFPYCDIRVDMEGQLIGDPEPKVSFMFLTDSHILLRYPDGTLNVTNDRGTILDSGVEAPAMQALRMTAYIP